MPSEFKVGGAHCTSPSDYKAGIIDWITEHIKPIGILCVVFVVPQLMVLCAACLLSCRSRMSRSHIDNDDEGTLRARVWPRWYPLCPPRRAARSLAAGV